MLISVRLSTRQHAAGGPPRQAVQLLGRLLVARLHPVRVPVRRPPLEAQASPSAVADRAQWPSHSAGFPPFSGATSDETWTNLKNWQKVLTRPVYTNPKDLIFNMSDEAWDAITQSVSHRLRRAPPAS